MRRIVVALVACACMSSAGELRAQTRADSAAVLLHAAEQLRLRGEAGAARALLDLIARQYAGTPAAAELDRLRELLRGMPVAERSGRTELLVFGTGYGAWLGVAVPLAMESENEEAYGIGLLLGAPAGFFAARQYVNAKQPTYGQARALTFGGTWGTYMGVATAELLDLGTETFTSCPPEGPCTDFESDPDGTTYVTSAVIGGLLGIGTGAFLARKPISAGTAAAVSLGGMWGTWYGFALSVLADLDGDELLGGTMIGGNAALVTLGLIAPRWQLSESRARLISVGGLIGGLAGLGMLLIAQPEDENTAILVPLIGTTAGIGLAAHLTRERSRTDDDTNSRGALLNGNDGRWALDAPTPALTFRRAPDGTLRPAAYVPILNVRF